MIRPCKVCGAGVKIIPSREGRKKYCSRRCSDRRWTLKPRPPILVDPEDQDLLVSMAWNIVKGQARANKSGGGSISIHRIIMNRMLGRPLLLSEEVDHENRIPLDNRRANLRLATHVQNGMNRGPGSRNTSGYKGVAARGGKWACAIAVKKVQIYIGVFAEREEAAYVYDQVALQLHGEFAYTNFEYGTE